MKWIDSFIDYLASNVAISWIIILKGYELILALFNIAFAPNKLYRAE
jgi:hypothetical protein